MSGSTYNPNGYGSGGLVNLGPATGSYPPTPAYPASAMFTPNDPGNPLLGGGGNQLARIGVQYPAPSPQALANLGGGYGYQGGWQGPAGGGQQMQYPGSGWGNPYGSYNPYSRNALSYQGGDMGLTDISQWLPYQTYAQFMPQQPQGQWQGQPQGQQQSPPQGQQPQGQGGGQLDPWQQQQQMQMLMQIAGIGRPNLGAAGTG